VTIANGCSQVLQVTVRSSLPWASAGLEGDRHDSRERLLSGAQNDNVPRQRFNFPGLNEPIWEVRYEPGYIGLG
jgi:hypothetical protein